MPYQKIAETVHRKHVIDLIRILTSYSFSFDDGLFNRRTALCVSVCHVCACVCARARARVCVCVCVSCIVSQRAKQFL